jgi:hypothetical protein
MDAYYGRCDEAANLADGRTDRRRYKDALMAQAKRPAWNILRSNLIAQNPNSG